MTAMAAWPEGVSQRASGEQQNEPVRALTRLAPVEAPGVSTPTRARAGSTRKDAAQGSETSERKPPEAVPGRL
jgi:hypothetical protein